jgi:hypothetical protein
MWRRVFFLEAIREGSDERPVGLPTDLGLIAELVVKHQVELVDIDPLMAYLECRVNAHKDQDVRRALYPLKRLAEQTGAAVVVVRHLTKAATGRGLYCGGGSIGILGAARSALVVGRDPGEDGQRVLAVNKSNLGLVPASLSFTLADDPSGVARVEWLGESPRTAAEVLATSGATPEPAPSESRADACAAAIRELLGLFPRPVKELEKALSDRGFSARAIREGRKRAGVRVEFLGFGGAGFWQASLAPEEEAVPG